MNGTTSEAPPHPAAMPVQETYDYLLDKNGDAVRVGDWIRDFEGRLARVEKLRPVEAHEKGNLYAKTGVLDPEFSAFGVRWPGTGDSFVMRMLDTLNVRGDSTGSVGLARAERVAADEAEVARLELRSAEKEIEALESARAIVDRRIREATTVRDALAGQVIGRE